MKAKKLHITTTLLVLFLLSGTPLTAQFEIPPKPQKQTSVYDYTELLSSSEMNTLEQKLIRYSDTTSTQIVVAIIRSTEGENITYLGAQWGEAWGIGQADKDNGILILLAQDDRRIAINTGEGIEHLLTDALSKRIIENVILPEFRKGDYYNGLSRGADVIFQVLQGEYKGEGNRRSKPGFNFGNFIFIGLIFFLILMVLSKRRGGRGGRGPGGRRGPDLWDVIILSNMGRRSSGGFGSGGGFGGGGFGGGFGGGGFGGGGASGGW